MGRDDAYAGSRISTPMLSVSTMWKMVPDVPMGPTADTKNAGDELATVAEGVK